MNWNKIINITALILGVIFTIKIIIPLIGAMFKEFTEHLKWAKKEWERIEREKQLNDE